LYNTHLSRTCCDIYIYIFFFFFCSFILAAVVSRGLSSPLFNAPLILVFSSYMQATSHDNADSISSDDLKTEPGAVPHSCNHRVMQKVGRGLNFWVEERASLCRAWKCTNYWFQLISSLKFQDMFKLVTKTSIEHCLKMQSLQKNSTIS